MATTTTNYSTLTEHLASGEPHLTNLSGVVNASTVSGALDFRNLVLLGGTKASGIQEVSYGTVLPLLIAIGTMLSAFAIFLLTRPRLRTRPASRYYLLLVSCDLLIFLVCVPVSITWNGCRASSYDVALYLVHGSNTVFYVLQTFALYVLAWVSYDRFLGLYNFKRFHDVRTPRVFRNRAILTVVVCVATHLRHLLQVEVTCSSSVSDADGTCDGVWIVDDVLHLPGRRTALELLLWVARGLVAFAIPVVSILVFNVCVVVGLFRHRVRNAAATRGTRRQAFSSISFCVAFCVAFVVGVAPVSVYSVFYADEARSCRGSASIFRDVANLLLTSEHLTHFLFLSFNQTFRTELWDHVATSIRLARGAFRRSGSRLRPREEALDAGPSAAHAQEPALPVFVMVSLSPQEPLPSPLMT